MKIKVNADAKWFVHNGKLYPIVDGEVEVPDEETNNVTDKEKEEKKKK